MIKADNFLKNDISNILMYGYKDENPRPHWKDGSPAYSLSVNQIVRKYDISKGDFPITTLRPQAWKTAIKEILAIYQAQTNNLDEMKKMGINWWADWDIGDGTIGYRYGHTVKRYNLIDKLITDLKENPFGRRHIMDMWQEQEFSEEPKGLNPCAFLTMWNVRKINNIYYLDMTLIQRSGDMLCASGGGCVNEIQYAALLMMISQVCGYNPGIFVHFVQNEQIYERHIDQAKELLNRNSYPLADVYSPMLHINPIIKDFYQFTIDDFSMEHYPIDKIKEINPQLKFELAI